MVVSFATVKESVPEHINGAALTLVKMGVFLTTTVVQAGYGGLIAWWASSDEVSPDNYRAALALPAALSLIGLVAALGVRESFPAAAP